ncbi:MAG: S-adenosyl-l-methionine hydroxide adenosyltransferase family protein [Solirubrobacteraceae bacterium]
MNPLITFLSDYGLGNEFVGVCHAVIARRCPQARVIDLTHAIPRHDVHTGAIVLRATLPYLPEAIILAVVDPGVGTSGARGRRAVAVRTVEQDRLLVGPDNGLLLPVCERLGGIAEAVDVHESDERLEPVSATFHGRDIFAPVAAALADGAPLDGLGEPLDGDSLRRLNIPVALMTPAGLELHVLHRDTFGNLILDGQIDQLTELGVELGDEVWVRCTGGTHRATFATTFADVHPGGLLLYQDGLGMLALAVNRGSAAELLGTERHDELLVGTG